MDNSFNMDKLFEQASRIETEVSFEDTKQAFMKSLILSAGGVLATKGVLKLLTTKKWLIMISAITTISTASVVAVMSFVPNDKEPIEASQVITTNASDDQNIIQEEFVIEPLSELGENFQMEEDGVEDSNSDIIIFESEDFDPTADFIIYEEFDNDDTSHIEFDANGNIAKTKKIIPYAERFEITSNTTEDELRAMQTKAEEAGIKFNYKAKIKNNKLQRISIQAKIDQRNNQQSMSITSDDLKDSDAPVVFGWFEDDKGNANEMGYGDEKNLKCCTGKGTNCSDHIHLDDGGYNNFIFSDDIEDALDELVDLEFEISDDLKDVLEDLEDDLEKMGEELELTMNEIDMSEINSILDDLQLETIDLMDELEEQIEELILKGIDIKVEIDEDVKEEKENKTEK